MFYITQFLICYLDDNEFFLFFCFNMFKPSDALNDFKTLLGKLKKKPTVYCKEYVPNLLTIGVSLKISPPIMKFVFIAASLRIINTTC